MWLFSLHGTVNNIPVLNTVNGEAVMPLWIRSEHFYKDAKGDRKYVTSVAQIDLHGEKAQDAILSLSKGAKVFIRGHIETAINGDRDVYICESIQYLHTPAQTPEVLN